MARNWKKIILVAVGTLVGAGAGIALALPHFVTINGPILSTLFGGAAGTPSVAQQNSRFHLPDGYRLSVFAQGLDRPRMMTVTKNGDLLVAEANKGRILLFDPAKPGSPVILAAGLDAPTSVDTADGWLYVGEAGQVSRAPFDAAARKLSGPMTVAIPNLPKGGGHRTRTVGIGPDGKLYVTVGSTCNVCIEENRQRASILRADPDGSNLETYATGLRNSVGFDWQPETGALYATDNGRDMLGDDFPPCELNRIKKGGFYGWPFRNGMNVVDPDFGARGGAGAIPPAYPFPAHVAPLGIRFIDRSTALVALHGSWNRSKKSGYKVVSLHFGADGKIAMSDFMTGFEVREDVIGRPVDIAVAPDGAIFISDDFAGVIWRVAKDGKGAIADLAKAAKADPRAGPGPVSLAALDAAGAKIFEAKDCRSCHDTDGSRPELKRLQHLSARYTVDSLQKLLMMPPGVMPAPDVDPEARRALAVHLLHTYP